MKFVIFALLFVGACVAYPQKGTESTGPSTKSDECPTEKIQPLVSTLLEGVSKLSDKTKGSTDVCEMLKNGDLLSTILKPLLDILSKSGKDVCSSTLKKLGLPGDSLDKMISSVGGKGDLGGSLTGDKSLVGGLTKDLTGAAGDATKGSSGTVGGATKEASGGAGDATKGASGTVGGATKEASGAAGDATKGASGTVGGATDGASETTKIISGPTEEKSGSVTKDEPAGKTGSGAEKTASGASGKTVEK